MAIRTDTVNLIVNVNGNVAQNQLNELRKRAADLTYEMKNNLKRGTQEYIAAAAELKKVNADMSALKQTIGITSLSQKELTAEMKKLTALRNSAAPFSAEYKQWDTQLKAVKTRLFDVQNGVTGLSSVFLRFQNQIKTLGTFAVGYLGFQFITSQFQNLIKGSGKLSDQLADLRRVAGLTADEASRLDKSLRQLDTRTANSDLRDIAVTAGKLGVAKDDILGFTEAVDKLVVSLGDELGDADQITTQLGKILNVFDGKINGDNITRLGNAFVELANTGASTGGFIADFDQRLSGIAKSAGIGLGALSGLGAGLEELGGRVESSATALQKLIVSIASDIPAAAKIAGQSTEEFDKLFKTDPTEAILKYSEGLVKSKESFAEVTASLKDAGEEGARTIETISKLGASADYLRTRIDLGKKAILENGAITDAFALKNENLGGEIDKLGKEFNRLMTSSAVIDFLKGAVIGARDFVKWLKDIPTFIRENRIALSLLITAFLALNKQLIISNLLWLQSKAAIVLETAAKAAGAVITLGYRAILLSFAAAQAIAAGNITRAAAAMRLLNLAFKSSPVGALIAGVLALGIALDSAFSKMDRMTKAQNDLAKNAIDNYGDQVNKIEVLKKALESENTGYEQKKKILQELIAINPEFAETLRLDADGHLFGAEAINDYIAALKRKGEAEAAQSLSNEQNKEILKLQQTREEWVKSENLSAQVRKKMIDDLDVQIKKLQQVKDFYDGIVVKNIQTTQEFVLPADTTRPGQASSKEDSSVAARRAQLTKMIDDSKAAYERLNKNDEAGQKANLALRAKYQAELDALDHKLTPASRKANSDYARLRKEAEEFYKQIQKLKEDALNASKSDDEKELLALENKYKELQAKALEFFRKNIISTTEYHKDLKALTEAFNIEMDALRKKFFDQSSAEEYAQSLKASDDYFDTLKRNVERQYAEGKISKDDYEKSLTLLEGREITNRIGIANDYSGTVKKAAEDVKTFTIAQEDLITKNLEKQRDLRIALLQDEAKARREIRNIQINDPETSPKQRADLKKKNATEDKDAGLKDLKDRLKAAGLAFDDASVNATDEAKAIWDQFYAAIKEADQELLNTRIAGWENFSQQLLTVTSNFFDALNNLDQRQLRKDKALNDAKKNNYKKQLDDKLISQKQYDKKIAEADAELEKKKHEADLKAFKRQQALAIAAALINGALAVTATLAARPGLADIFSLGVARAIQVGLVIAATAGQVAAIATQQPPEAAEGNWFRKGDKHKDPSGGIPVMIERDEAVMKADAMTDTNTYTVTGTPSQITSKLNSMHGGVNWASGATIRPMFMQRPAQINPNLPRIMAEGGLVNGRGMNQIDTTNQEIAILLRQVIAGQEIQTSEIKNQRSKLHAEVSIKEYRETEKKYDQARKAGGMSQ